MALKKDKQQELVWELSQNIIKIIKCLHSTNKIEELHEEGQTSVIIANRLVTWLKTVPIEIGQVGALDIEKIIIIIEVRMSPIMLNQNHQQQVIGEKILR